MTTTITRAKELLLYIYITVEAQNSRVWFKYSFLLEGIDIFMFFLIFLRDTLLHDNKMSLIFSLIM